MGTHPNPLNLTVLETLLQDSHEEYRGWAREEERSRLLKLSKKGDYEAVKSFYTRYSSLIYTSGYREHLSAYLEALKYIAQQVAHQNRYEAAKALYDHGGIFFKGGRESIERNF
ncbi:MAG TPA: hypothetical protein PLY23_05315 [Alphaproteobacteria bacterium]|nr:hypothetical protein [Alphaproteobacteria bacterium]